MRNLLGVAKTVTTVVVVGAIAAFFYDAFSSNWSSVSQFGLELRVLPLAGSIALTAIGYLLFTYSWCLTLNRLSGRETIGFSESVAVVNTSNLTKYLPGKIWSFALQMYWLERIGFRKSLVLYVNMVNLLVALATTLALGFACLIAAEGGRSAEVNFAILGVLLAGIVVFVVHNALVTGLVVGIVNRLFRVDIEHFRIAPTLALVISAIHFAAAVSSGLAAYLLCVGIGFDIAPSRLFSIMAAALIGEVAGFVAIVVPGGLGVKEGVMFVILSASSSPTLALILPFASRLASMIVDALLGVVGYLFLRSLQPRLQREPTPDPQWKQ